MEGHWTRAAGCVVAITLTAGTAAVGFTSPIVDRPAVFVTLRVALCLGLVTVALIMLRRGPGDRLATSLVAIASMLALAGLAAADSPLPFTVGRAAVPVATLMGLHFFLAYPSGRIEERRVSVVFAVSAATVIALDAASVLVRGVEPLVGPFVRCAGARCPASAVGLIDAGRSARSAIAVALALVTSWTVAASAVHVAIRAARASRVQRHGLLPLLPWGLPAAIGYASFVAARTVNAEARLLTPAAVIVAAIVSAMPLAVAAALAGRRAFATTALRRMLERLGDARTPLGAQKAMSEAFADPTLRLLFWRPALQRYTDVDGTVIESSALPPTSRLSRFADGREDAVAVMHDPALARDRDILEAGALALRLALDSARIEFALSSSTTTLKRLRRRLASAAHEERQRMERDLHDGLQQNLIALSVRLRRLEEAAADDPSALAPGLADAGRRVQSTIDQVRELANGIYPATLRDLGLPYALAAVARNVPFELALHIETRRRFGPEVECAIYFCCLEALQNISKHCGPGTHACLRVFECGGRLQISVVDDGPGFEATQEMETRGITHMRDRAEAIGGTLSVTSTPGSGTRVTGTVPLATG